VGLQEEGCSGASASGVGLMMPVEGVQTRGYTKDRVGKYSEYRVLGTGKLWL
jgi:hypothetical protein